MLRSNPQLVSFSHSCAQCLVSQFPANTEQRVLVSPMESLSPPSSSSLEPAHPRRFCLSSHHLLFTRRSVLPTSRRLCWEHHPLLWGIWGGQFLLRHREGLWSWSVWILSMVLNHRDAWAASQRPKLIPHTGKLTLYHPINQSFVLCYYRSFNIIGMNSVVLL